MAAALAVLHWAVRTDADDVEFVLAGKPPFSAPVRELDPDVIWDLPEDTSTLDLTCPVRRFGAGHVHLWLLDFNLCGVISMDERGVEKAVKAFFKNDPYFPRPVGEGCRDQELWETFREEYLRVGGEVLEGGLGEWRGLPGRFVEGVEEEQRTRLACRAGDAALGGPPEE